MSSNKKRSKAREIAIQGLYQCDLQSESAGAPVGTEDVRSFVEGASDDSEVRRNALTLIDGTMSCLEDLDELISKATDHWKLERVAALDRAILRLAVFELLEVEEVPPKVAINEAIELAKRFSTAQSGGFVNGVLDRVLRDLEAKPEADSACAPTQPTEESE